MIARLSNLGSIGVVKDLDGYELPPLALTTARNVRALGPSLEKADGDKLLEYLFLATGFTINGILPTISGSAHYWILCAPDKAYAYGTSVNEVTGALGVFNSNYHTRWNGGTLNGVFVLNNGVDPPRMWNFPGGGTELETLSNWQAGVLARVIRPYKNYLVALAVTKAGVFDKRLVKWSHPAAPLTVPSSWDESNPAVDAGEVSLAQGLDALVDCGELGNANIVYTEGQTWAMQLAGNNQIFSFRLLFPDSGLLAQDCFTAFAKKAGGPTMHFVVTYDDFKIHDGSSITSVGSDRVKEYFFDRISATSRNSVRVVNKKDQDEIWVFHASGNNLVADNALIWNYRYNTWYYRDTPRVRGVAVSDHSGDSTIRSWDDLTGAWSAQTWQWGDFAYVGIHTRMLMFDEDTFLIKEVSPVHLSFNGTDITSVIERTGLPIKGVDRNGEPIFDENSKAILRRIWPRVHGNAGDQILVEVGYQETRESDVTWLPGKYFTIGGTRPVNFVMTYRYLSFRLTLTTSEPWRLQSLELEIDPTSKF